MAHWLDRLAVRMWLLAGLMTIVTLAVAVAFYFATMYLQLYNMTARMPPKARAEFEELIRNDQRASNRYFELVESYSGDDLLPGDWLLLSVIVLISTGVGGSLAYVFARRISRPITAVAAAAARVAAGELSVRVSKDGASGEIGDLVDRFNFMADEIETYERERSILSAGIAHELRTPLTILKGRLHGVIDGVIDGGGNEALRLLRQVEQLSRIVEDLRTLAHANASELALDVRSIDAGMVVGTAIADLVQEAATAGVRIHHVLGPVRVRADPGRMTQIVTNILTNAIKNSPAQGVIEVSIEHDDVNALIKISDEGPGFDPEHLNRMFVPFWRDSASKFLGRPGSGLGLALAAGLVEAQGGSITAENRELGTGACFIVTLPIG